VGGSAQVGPMRKVAGRLKGELSQYRDLEAFSQFGSDLDRDTQRTLARGERLVKALNQGERSPIPVEEQVAMIYAATNGYLDRIDADRVEEFLRNMQERLRSSASDTLGKIREGDWGDDVQSSLADAIKEFASDFGYDLDEEGMPLDEEVPVHRRENGGAKAEDESEEGSPADAASDEDDRSAGDDEEGSGKTGGAVAAGSSS
jgi:F-type H+/Na+-transporting ATPase subunit alpha